MKHEANSLLLSSKEIGGFLKKICGRGVSFKFTAKGASMVPFICDGDTLIIEAIPIKKGIRTGDVVAYIQPKTGLLIVHRVIKEQEGEYLLKGDNVYTCDGYCEKKDIHGFVKEIIKKEKPNRFFNSLNNHKRAIALLSRYKLLTPVCRLVNKILWI